MIRLPIVSIVTPSFNQAPFLEATIRSVLEQDYRGIEYMVADGGSTDGSVEIIRKYESHLAWWCSEKDDGQSAAINKGWRRAKGEIWAYLNSDDLLLPGAVRAVVDTAMTHPEVGILHGDWVYIDECGREMDRGHGRPANFGKLLRDGQIRYVAQPASFYRGDLVSQVGWLNETLHLSMDYDLLLRLARIAPILYIQQPLAACRLHVNAKSTGRAEAHWHENFTVLRRYGRRYLLLPWLLYCRYRFLRAMPATGQNLFRRWRHSVADQVYLHEVGDRAE